MHYCDSTLHVIYLLYSQFCLILSLWLFFIVQYEFKIDFYIGKCSLNYPAPPL